MKVEFEMSGIIKPDVMDSIIDAFLNGDVDSITNYLIEKCKKGEATVKYNGKDIILKEVKKNCDCVGTKKEVKKNCKCDNGCQKVFDNFDDVINVDHII